ncbi:hypothetical protein EON83_20400 [bacterium]|nr:MAG: hypothetical protein EON83_20400 [bacterium]
MSVGFCAHLYYPDEPFNAGAFESWHHRPSNYRPDEEPESAVEVAQDYVPRYSWLDSAVAEIKARKSLIPKATLKPLFRLVPFKPNEIEPSEEDMVWDSGESHVRLCLIQSFHLLEEASKSGSLTYKEHLKYVRRVHQYAAQMERDLTPSLGSRIMQLVRPDEN